MHLEFERVVPSSVAGSGKTQFAYDEHTFGSHHRCYFYVSSDSVIMVLINRDGVNNRIVSIN